MAANVRLQRVRVNTSSADTEGRLVFADGDLVAVVVRLDGDEHGEFRGRWLLEAGFGPCDDFADLFGSLDEVKRWVRGRVRPERRSPSGTS